MDIESIIDEMMKRMEDMSRNPPHRMISELAKGEIFLLGFLQGNGGIASSSAMGKALGTSTARIAAAVKNMERKGWVYRETDPADQRKTRVIMTPEGHDHMLGYRERARAALKEVLQELGEADAAEYLRITGRMNQIVAEKQLKHF